MDSHGLKSESMKNMLYTVYIMIGFLLNIDYYLTDFIFRLPHPFPLTIIFQSISMISDFYVIIAGILFIYITIIFILLQKKKIKNKLIIPFISAIIISWFISEYIIKNIIQRPRPDLNPIITISGQISGFSFPSTHTFVAFAAAFVLSTFNKKRAKIFYIIAGLIAFSRVYLGYHYLSDVIAGAILGIGIGYIILKLKINRLG